MPHRPLKPCRYPGCGALATTGQSYCPPHRRVRERERLLVDPTLATAKQFYQSTAWRRLRAYHLKRFPLCIECEQPATVVDHVHRIRSGGSRLDPENLQSLCESCHNRKRARESRE